MVLDVLGLEFCLGLKVSDFDLGLGFCLGCRVQGFV